MPQLNDLVAYLAKKNISVQEIDDLEKIIFELKFYTDQGRPLVEELEVSILNNQLQVRATNSRYPNLCPYRHINNGGFFCLGLKEDLAKLSIDQWIITVKQFLEAQYQCEMNNVWPHNEFKEWAHGDGAIYQKKVEHNFEDFKKNPLKLPLEQLAVVELISLSRNKQKIYHIYADDKLLLVGDKKQVFNKRYACICNKHGLKNHRSIGKCPDKCSQILFIVAINDYLLNQAEKEFWACFGEQKCCNTMKKCNFKK